MVSLAVLMIALWRPQPYAYERSMRDSGSNFEEEDLSPDSHRVTLDDESVYDDTEDDGRELPGETEDEVSRRGPRTVPETPLVDDSIPRSVDPQSAPNEEAPEESPIVTSGPPALPAASALPPRDQVALNFIILGVTSVDKEDFEQARQYFERAIEIAPLQPYSYYFLGKLALTRGEHQKALPLLRKANILLTHGDRAWRSETMSAQGAVYEDLGELPQARRAYRRSLQLFPQNLRAMSALARLAEEEPDSDDTVSQ